MLACAAPGCDEQAGRGEAGGGADHGEQVAASVRGRSAGRAGRRAAPGCVRDDQRSSRSRRWWWRRWSRTPRTRRIGRGRRWRARDRAVDVDDRADLEGVSSSSRIGPIRSSCRPIRCSWRRSSMWSGSISIRRSAALVLCVDEKSQVQALARCQPVLPMMPGMPEKRTHDYVRHGVTSLFAAFDVADGTVISARCTAAIARSSSRSSSPRSTPRSPPDLDVHVVATTYGTHKTPTITRLADQPPPLPHALHPDQLQLAQPGRTLVRPTSPTS